MERHNPCWHAGGCLGSRGPAIGQGDGMLWLIGATVVVVGALLAIQPLLNARIAHVLSLIHI